MYLRRQFSRRCPALWWNFSLMRKYPVELQAYGVHNFSLMRYEIAVSVAGFACFSVSNWLYAAPAEAHFRTGCSILLFSPRSALGESRPTATTCCCERGTPAASLRALC